MNSKKVTGCLTILGMGIVLSGFAGGCGGVNQEQKRSVEGPPCSVAVTEETLEVPFSPGPSYVLRFYGGKECVFECNFSVDFLHTAGKCQVSHPGVFTTVFSGCEPADRADFSVNLVDTPPVCQGSVGGEV